MHKYVHEYLPIVYYMIKQKRYLGFSNGDLKPPKKFSYLLRVKIELGGSVCNKRCSEQFNTPFLYVITLIFKRMR